VGTHHTTAPNLALQEGWTQSWCVPRNSAEPAIREGQTRSCRGPYGGTEPHLMERQVLEPALECCLGF
jgi:hypothetical protein